MTDRYIGAKELKCSRDYGTIIIPPDATEDEIKQLIINAVDIWTECTSGGRGYLCKCSLANSLFPENDDLEESSKDSNS